MSRPEDRFPLTWPTGWKRTPLHQRSSSPFKISSSERAFRELEDELGRLGARSVMISSNLELRLDGRPYANQKRNEDEGVAIYFLRKGKEMVLACDKFRKREDNMRAITKTIEAIRGIERWGSSDMMERAFTGFAQLAGPMDVRQWWQVLGVQQGASVDDAEKAYLRLRSTHHPDRGGDPAEFNAVIAAWDQYRREHQ